VIGTGVAPRMVVAGLALMLAACQGATPGQSAGASPTATLVATPEPTAVPTSTPLPLAVPRPTDIPTDGSCEQNRVCLGLLESGKSYTTTAFTPQLTFTMPEAGWENISDEGGILQLLLISSPGDTIAFFRDPRATDATGGYAEGVGASASELAVWLAANPLLVVTPAQPVTVGSLSGMTMDITVAPGTEREGPADCPVLRCVPFFRGMDASKFTTWAWDWGSAGVERQRLYLLTATEGVVAIFVDSLDGTTFDALTKTADKLLPTLTFH